MKTNNLLGHRISCWDNGGHTADRFTVAYHDQPEGQLVVCRGMSEWPYHPQGFGQMTSGLPGPHLGKRIQFTELPSDCQKLVILDLTDNLTKL